MDLDSEGQYAIDVIPESYILEHQPQRALDFIERDPRRGHAVVPDGPCPGHARPDGRLGCGAEATTFASAGRNEFEIAEIYAHRGDTDRAFDWLRGNRRWCQC